MKTAPRDLRRYVQIWEKCSHQKSSRTAPPPLDKRQTSARHTFSCVIPVKRGANCRGTNS
jgi:hypothetical protein